jgi:hypothetical protein
MRKEQLDNLTEGPGPSLHPATPDWGTLKALVERAAATLADARRTANSAATRFNAAYRPFFDVVADERGIGLRHRMIPWPRPPRAFGYSDGDGAACVRAPLTRQLLREFLDAKRLM